MTQEEIKKQIEECNATIRRMDSGGKNYREYLKYKRKQFCHICNLSFILCPELCAFHHPDREDKSINISTYRRTSIKEGSVLMNEIKKCIPLCENCHHSIHHGNGIYLLGVNHESKNN